MVKKQIVYLYKYQYIDINTIYMYIMYFLLIYYINIKFNFISDF